MTWIACILWKVKGGILAYGLDNVEGLHMAESETLKKWIGSCG
jgi:hypothetical protein